mgnify:CR=1 FL=1
MSCSSLKRRFEAERQKGITFERAMEMYRELEGSLATHRLTHTEKRGYGSLFYLPDPFYYQHTGKK